MASPPRLQFGPYRLEGSTGQLWRHGQLVPLPPKAVAVLWCLATRGEGQAGLAQLRQGMAAISAAGEMLSRPLCLALDKGFMDHQGGEKGEMSLEMVGTRGDREGTRAMKALPSSHRCGHTRRSGA